MDAKGTEEVFESLPELNGISNSQIIVDNVPESEDIDVTSVQAGEAFAAFNGRLFFSSSSSSGAKSHKDESLYTVVDENEAKLESPIQRLARIKSELSALHADVESMRASKKAETEGATLWSTLQSEAKRTIESIKVLEKDPLLAMAEPGTASGVHELESLVDRMALGANVQIEGGKADTANTLSSREPSLALLERRLFALENVLGSTSNMLDVDSVDGHDVLNRGTRGSGMFPLVDCIARMERRISALDERSLESMRTKAASVHAELEAISREKNRGATTAELKAIEAAALVDDLVERAKHADAVAKDVPQLLLRLKTLEGTHVAAATCAKRLGGLEVGLREASELVGENAEVLKALRTSLTSSINIFKDNIERIDGRIEKLST